MNLDEKQNKKDYAYQELKRRIISGELPADANLVERQICDMLGLSRTPVRAALQELENDGLVINYKGRGVVVSKIQLEDFVEVFQLRSALDILALKLFMQSNNTEIIEKMRKTVTDMAICLEKEDFASFVKCDSDFHEYYFFHTGNKRLGKIMTMVSDQIKRILNLTASDRERCQSSYRDHMKMIAAIEAGDSAKAVKLVQQHIAESLEYHVKKATRMD